MIYATEQQVVVTSVAIVTVALVALFVGIIYGRRRGLEEAAEEQQWEREQTETRRTHPVYRPVRWEDLPPDQQEAWPRPEVAHEDWTAHENQALTLANETLGEEWDRIHPGWREQKMPRPGDPTFGGKLHDIHGGPGQDCWCGYVGHDLLGSGGAVEVADSGCGAGGAASADNTVLNPTAVIGPGEESTTAWTRRMAEDMDAFLKGLIGRTDEQLREITR